MAHGGIEKYYNPANKVVNDGDTAFADDINNINYAVDTALAQVADDLDVMSANLAAAGGANLTSLRENIKVTVGAGGGFPTINAAVLHLSRFTPDLGVTAEVELQSGFVMREQLLVKGLNLGWITITGVDAETVINEPSLTRVLINYDKPAFGVINGTLPTIGQLFRFSSKGSENDSRHGVMAHSAGRANILPGCGVKNAGEHCIHAESGSTINAQGAIASGAGFAGFRAKGGSTINAQGADASGAGYYGIRVESGSTVNANSVRGTLFQAENTITGDGIIFQF